MSTKLFLIASSLLTVTSCINVGQATDSYNNSDELISNNTEYNEQDLIKEEKALRNVYQKLQEKKMKLEKSEKAKRRKEKVEFHQGQTTKINYNTNKEANRIISEIKDLTNTNTGVITNKIDETRKYLGKIDETNKQAHTNIINTVKNNTSLITNMKETLEKNQVYNKSKLDNINIDTKNILKNISTNKKDVLDKLGSIEDNINEKNNVYYMQFDALNNNITGVETSIKTELSKHTKALDDIKNGINSEIKQCNESKAKITEKYESQIKLLNQQINSLTINLNTEYSKHTDDLNKRQEEIQSLNERYKVLTDEYNSDIKTIQKEYTIKITELNNQYNQGYQKLQQTLSQYKEALDKNTEQLNTYMGSNETLHQNTFNKVNEARETILKTLSDINRKIIENSLTLNNIVEGFKQTNDNINILVKQNEQTIKNLEKDYNDQVQKLTNELKQEKAKNSKNQEEIEQITNTYNQNILDLKTKHLTKIAKVRNTCNEQIIELQNKYRNDYLVTQQVLTNNSLALKEQTSNLELLIKQNTKLDEYLRNQFTGVNTKLDSLNKYITNKERNKIIKNLSLTLDKNEIKKIKEEYNTYIALDQIKFLEPIIRLLYIKIVNSAGDFNRKLSIYAGNNLTIFNTNNVNQIIYKLETCIQQNNINEILNMLQNIDKSPNNNIYKPKKILQNKNIKGQNRNIKGKNLEPVRESQGSINFDKVPTLKEDLDKLEKLVKNKQYNHVQLMYKLLNSVVKQSKAIVNKQSETYYFTSDDFKEDITLLCDSLKQYFGIIDEWNKSLDTEYLVQEYNLIQQKDNYKYEDDIFYKYWFNTCIKYCFGDKKKERNINDIYHAVKCVLYDSIEGTKNVIKNDELREYVNNCVKKLFDGNTRIAVLFDRLISNCEFQQAENVDSDYEGDQKDMKKNEMSYDKNILSYKIRNNNPQFVIKNKILFNRNNDPQSSIYSKKIKFNKNNIDQKVYKFRNDESFSSESSDSY